MVALRTPVLTRCCCAASSALLGIKAIKLYAWEDAYVKRIGELRDKELVQIRRTQMLSALNTAVFVVSVDRASCSEPA